MRRIFYCICILCATVAAKGATITGLVQQVMSSSQMTFSNVTLRFESQELSPIVTATGIASLVTKYTKTTGAGAFAASNVLAGNYKVYIGDFPKDFVKLQVPDGDYTTNWLFLLTTNFTTTGNFNGMFQLKSEKGVSNGYASLDSSGTVPTNQLPMSQLGGSGGGITLAQAGAVADTVSKTNISNTNAVIQAQLALKAPIASPTFTGIPNFNGLIVDLQSAKERIDNGSYRTNGDSGRVYKQSDNSREAHYSEVLTVAGDVDMVDARVQALESASATATYYVDQVNGSDLNAGTSLAQAFQSFSKLTNVAGVNLNSVTIYLARGSHWREQLTVGSNSIVRAIGSGPEPIISACDVVTNWVKTGGWTNTYSVTNFTFTGGGGAAYISIAENGMQLYRSNTLAAVDATPGTFFAIDNPPAGSATNIIYIHPRGNTSPTNESKVYEVGKRNYALLVGDNCNVEDVVARGPQLSNNGSFEAHRNALLRRVSAFNGSKHNFFVTSGYLEDCRAYFSEYNQQSATLFVHFDNSDGLKVKYVRCSAGGSAEFPASATAFYGHTLGSGYGYVEYKGCRSEFAQSWGSPGLSTNGIAVIYQPSTLGASLSGWTFYAGTNLLIEPLLYFSPLITESPSFTAVGVAGSGSLNWIAGAKISGAPYSVVLSAGITNSRIELHQSILSGAGQAILCSGTNNTIVFSNNIASGFVKPLDIAANNAAPITGGNLYPSTAQFTINGVNYGTWGAYVAAYPSSEVGSVTNAPQFIGDFNYGDFRFSSTSPAVTNLAGLWAAPRLPFPVPSIGIVPALNVGGEWISGQQASSSTALSNLAALKLNRSGDTVSVFSITGSFTNYGADRVQVNGAANLDFNLNKANNDGYTLWQNFQQNGTTYGRVGLLADSTHNLKLEGVSAGLDLWAGSGNALRLFGGNGGGNLLVAGNGSGSTNFVMDGNGKIGILTNVPRATLHVNGHALIEGGSTNIGPQKASIFYGDGSQLTAPNKLDATNGNAYGMRFPSGATSNYVWTCTNAATGQGEWRDAALVAGGGEANTTSNGTTTNTTDSFGLAMPKSGVDLPVKVIGIGYGMKGTNSDSKLIVAVDSAIIAPLASPQFSGQPSFQGLTVNAISAKWRVDNGGSYVTNTDNGEAWIYGDLTSANSQPAHAKDITDIADYVDSENAAQNTRLSNVENMTNRFGTVLTISNQFVTLSNQFVTLSNNFYSFSNTFFPLSNNFVQVSNNFFSFSNAFYPLSNNYVSTSNALVTTSNRVVALENLDLNQSNYLWRATNTIVTAGLTNSSTGARTNTMVLTPGENYALLLETNATVRYTNFSGNVAGMRALYSATILTGPGNITASWNAGAIHGLYWRTNENSPMWTTLTNGSTYEWSASVKGTNVLQSIILVK